MEIDIRVLAAERLERQLEEAWQQRDFARAAALIAEVTRAREEAFGLGAAPVVDAWLEWAEIERQAGDANAARSLLERGLGAEEARGDHTRAAHVAFQLGALLADERDFTGALPHLQRAVNNATDTWRTAAEGTLVSVLVALGKTREAATLLAEMKVDAAQRTRWLDERARLMRSLQDASAFDLAEEAVLACDPRETPPLDAAEAHSFLAELHEERDQLERALVLYRAAHEFYSLGVPPGHPQLGIALLNVALVEQRTGQKARATAERALQILVKALGAKHPQTLSAQQVLDSIVD